MTLTANDSRMVMGTQPPAVSIGPATGSRPSTGPQHAPATTRRTTRKPIPARIAIIDDEPLNIQVVQKYLYEAGYEQFITTADSSKALDLICRERPDLILLDIMMPVVSGLDILQALQASETTRHLPVLVLTAVSDASVKREALESGATDFLPKPVDPHELLPRVRNSLLTKAYHDRLTNENARLETEVRRRTTELAASREEVVHCLARASEYRDDDTGHHVMRVGQYVGVIARGLGFTEGQIELLELAAQLHDLGKIAIPDSILHCPGKLDPEQFDLMKTHCGIAKKIMQPLAEEQWRILRSHARVGAGLLHVRSSPLLMLAAKIAQTHHEWWDGTGYPLGLAEEDIPIEGRMTAVADVYDALSSRRSYKEPFSREKSFAILEEGRGTHFDPKVLDVFFERKDEIINIQLQYMDVT